MKRLFLLAVLLAQTGCLTPLTRRLDEANERLGDVQRQLATANGQLAETKEELRKIEGQMADTNRHLATMQGHLKRFGGGVGADEATPPAPGQP